MTLCLLTPLPAGVKNYSAVNSAREKGKQLKNTQEQRAEMEVPEAMWRQHKRETRNKRTKSVRSRCPLGAYSTVTSACEKDEQTEREG